MPINLKDNFLAKWYLKTKYEPIALSVKQMLQRVLSH